MNKHIVTGLLCIIFSSSVTVFAASEPDESGIGGTGVKTPALEDSIFHRPDMPEIIDIPEVPDLNDAGGLEIFDDATISIPETEDLPANQRD